MTHMFSIEVQVNEIVETGIAMFQIEEYWMNPMSYFFFFTSIPEKYRKYFEQSVSLFKLRNALIVLAGLEIASSLIGCSYNFISKNEIHMIMSLCALFLSIAGVTFFSFINDIGIIFYSLLTICVPGLFFIHQLFQYALGQTSNDTSFYGFFSLLYVFDMLCGFSAIFYLKKISETKATIMKLEATKEEGKPLLNEANNSCKKKYSKSDLKAEFNKRIALRATDITESQISLVCVVCCEKTRQVLSEPCKHLLICSQCMTRLSYIREKKALTCPHCSRAIDYFSKIYF